MIEELEKIAQDFGGEVLYEGLTLEQIAELDKYRFQGLLKGLKKYIDEQMKNKPLAAIKIYQMKLDRYKRKYILGEKVDRQEAKDLAAFNAL